MNKLPFALTTEQGKTNDSHHVEGNLIICVCYKSRSCPLNEDLSVKTYMLRICEQGNRLKMTMNREILVLYQLTVISITIT